MRTLLLSLIFLSVSINAAPYKCVIGTEKWELFNHVVLYTNSRNNHIQTMTEVEVLSEAFNYTSHDKNNNEYIFSVNNMVNGDINLLVWKNNVLIINKKCN